MNTFKQGLHETALDFQAYFAEKQTDQPVLKERRTLQRIIPGSRIGLIKEIKYFSTKKEARVLMSKVPSTNGPERLIWVNACTEEVQNCRQIAAIKTVKQWYVRMLRETCSTERRIERQGKPWAWASGNSRKNLVYWSMLKRSSGQDAVRFIHKGSSVDEACWKTWQNRSSFLEGIHRSCSKS